MDQRNIDILSVSAVGLGCNNFGMKLDAAQTADVVHAALDAGVNFFDTADIYGGSLSEEYLGAALGNRRREVVLATKFGMPLDDVRKGAAPDYVRSACAASLKRLGTDYLDLYWLHQPDPATPIGDTLGALNELVSAGTVRQVGCSNFNATQLREADAEATRLGCARFVTLQNEYSLLHREPEAEVLPECRQLSITFVPYFPLASGMLTGKYRAGQDAPPGSRLAGRGPGRFYNEANLATVERLRAWVEQHNLQSGERRTILDLAFAWLLAHPQVASVIAGATSAAQVRANAQAGSWRLSPAERAEVDALLDEPAAEAPSTG